MRFDRTKARPSSTTQKGDKQFVRYDLEPPTTILNLPIGSVPTAVQRLGQSLSVYVLEAITPGTLVPHTFHIFALLQAIEVPLHFRFVGAAGGTTGNDYFHVFLELQGEE